MRKKSYQSTWYQKIVNAIHNGQTFDVAANDQGFTLYTELITWKIMDDFNLSTAQRMEVFKEWHRMVKTNINNAIAKVQESTPVYRGISSGGKNIEYLTIDRSYRDAKEDDIRRIKKLVKKTIVSQKKQYDMVAPNRNFGFLLNETLKTLQ